MRIIIFTFLSCLCVEGAYASPGYVSFNWFGRYKQAFSKGGGCVSGSITSDASIRKSYEFYFTDNIASQNFAKLGRFASYKKGNNTESTIGGTFITCLKPGRYEIFELAISSGMIGLNPSVKSSTKFSVTFQVDAGKHYYIGNILAYYPKLMGSRFYKESNCKHYQMPFFFEVINSVNRDLDAIEKLKEFPGVTPEVKLMDVANGAPYFVSCQELPASSN